MRFTTSQVANGAAELYAYGTAVVAVAQSAAPEAPAGAAGVSAN